METGAAGNVITWQLSIEDPKMFTRPGLPRVLVLLAASRCVSLDSGSPLALPRPQQTQIPYEEN